MQGYDPYSFFTRTVSLAVSAVSTDSCYLHVWGSYPIRTDVSGFADRWLNQLTQRAIIM